MELHTDDFPLLLNRDFYKDLIENFKLIEHECSQLESDLSNETSARINADNNERSERINQDANLQNQINELSGRMDQAESNISNLEQRVTDTEVGISKLNDRCEKLENLIKLLDSQLNSGMPLDNWLDKAKEGEDFDDLINEIE